MEQNDLELLKKIEENTSMGMYAIEKLLPSIQDDEFMKTIKEQYNDYETLHSECMDLAKNAGEDIKPQGGMKKMMSNINIQLQKIMDASPSHLSEMMISGSTMGINQITKQLNDYRDSTDDEISALADKVLHSEQKNIDNLRKYL